LRSTRLAEADLAALRFEAAREGFRAALDRDPELGEAWYGLALLHMEEGRADATYDACVEGLRRDLTEAQRIDLERMKSLVAPYAGRINGRAGSSDPRATGDRRAGRGSRRDRAY
jgi:tetratricopeptide (TPR) repeat protein